MARKVPGCTTGYWEHPKTYEQIMRGVATVSYNLTAYDPTGGSMQDISLKRKEYLKVQRFICKMRKLKPVKNGLEAEANGSNQNA
jgi:hypothetical protein